jgi:hypothetical protein
MNGISPDFLGWAGQTPIGPEPDALLVVRALAPFPVSLTDTHVFSKRNELVFTTGSCRFVSSGWAGQSRRRIAGVTPLCFDDRKSITGGCGPGKDLGS